VLDRKRLYAGVRFAGGITAVPLDVPDQRVRCADGLSRGIDEPFLDENPGAVVTSLVIS